MLLMPEGLVVWTKNILLLTVSEIEQFGKQADMDHVLPIWQRYWCTLVYFWSVSSLYLKSYHLDSLRRNLEHHTKSNAAKLHEHCKCIGSAVHFTLGLLFQNLHGGGNVVLQLCPSHSTLFLWPLASLAQSFQLARQLTTWFMFPFMQSRTHLTLIIM